MGTIFFKVEFLAGSSLKDCYCEAMQYINQLQIPGIEFEFNGVKLQVTMWTKYKDLESTYREGLRLRRCEMSCSKDKPYLHDVQVGDILYNFLERNKEYTVNEVRGEEGLDHPITIAGDSRVVRITLWGTEVIREKIPYFLYAPVDVLDPKNLPPRPWKPRKGEWVWCRDAKSSWDLRMFIREDKHGYLVASAFGNTYYAEIAPFKGELPPGLEEE